MSVPPEPIPSPRIGDAERDDAISLLQEHMASGRLDDTEFDQRMSTALTAKTVDDLDPLFADLPGRRPGQGLARTSSDPSATAWPTYPATAARGPDPGTGASLPAVPPPAQAETASPAQRVGASLLALLWPIVIIFNFATGFDYWWTWLIPVFASGAIGQVLGVWNNDGRNRDRHLRHQMRRDRDRRRQLDD